MDEFYGAKPARKRVEIQHQDYFDVCNGNLANESNIYSERNRRFVGGKYLASISSAYSLTNSNYVASTTNNHNTDLPDICSGVENTPGHNIYMAGLVSAQRMGERPLVYASDEIRRTTKESGFLPNSQQQFQFPVSTELTKELMTEVRSRRSQFPNQIQNALNLDRPYQDIEEMMRLEDMLSGRFSQLNFGVISAAHEPSQQCRIENNLQNENMVQGLRIFGASTASVDAFDGHSTGNTTPFTITLPGGTLEGSLLLETERQPISNNSKAERESVRAEELSYGGGVGSVLGPPNSTYIASTGASPVTKNGMGAIVTNAVLQRQDIDNVHIDEDNRCASSPHARIAQRIAPPPDPTSALPSLGNLPSPVRHTQAPTVAATRPPVFLRKHQLLSDLVPIDIAYTYLVDLADHVNVKGN